MASKKKVRTKKQKMLQESATAEAIGTIFKTPGSDVVPGEVILQLEEGASAAITESIPRGPTRGRALEGPTSFGVSAIDSALSKLKVTSVTRLHPPAPVASFAMTEAAALASTFRVCFEATTPVERAVESLAETEGVAYVEPNRWRESYVVPNDPSFPSQWGLSKINCPAAWDRTTGSANIVVAVIDTGVDLDHPELASLIVPGFDMVDLGPSPTPPLGFRFEGDFQGRDNVAQDEVGHGTHVAGTIACLSNNGVGVAGVTWNCRIMPVRVLARIVSLSNPNDVRGTGSAADIAAGIRWAVDNGARVLNLSLGGTTDTQVERDAIAYAIARGAVVVAAMGNGGPAAPPSYPAAYPDVVAVAAIDQTDRRAAFSQVGPHIDLSAPGVGILSTVWNNGYTTMQGTSMASPHVAGVAALVLSCNGSLTAAQVADILRQTARPLRDNPADPVPNNAYGFGCVDAAAAVARACPTVVKTVPITCRPSVVVRCPSTMIACRSETIACRRTEPIVCMRQTRPVVCLPQTSPVTCQQTSPITCLQTSPVTCPQPSALIRCPSGPVCGRPVDPRVGPGPLAAQGQPEGATDLGAYDPFAVGYGEEGGDW